VLLDLALVTDTLISLIDKWVAASPEHGKVSPLSMSAQPPDKLTGDHTIGVYLYHVVEDAHFKNLPSISDEVPPVRFTPMGLDLYYIVAPHSDMRDSTGTLNEQTMMGFALKALRDYPVIDDSTQINGAQVFPVALQGSDNRFRIVLQPVQHTEAMTYWTAGTQPLRLAAYYQVSVVLLEPELPLRRPGRVLTYGVFTARGAPYLAGSRSTVSFTIPGQPSRTVDVQPAQVSTGGSFSLFGSELSGDQTTLLITGTRPTSVEVGTDWGVIANNTEIQAVVQTRMGASPTVPGMYSAIAKVIERQSMPDGTTRDLVKTSNATPFVIAPSVTGVDPPDASQRVLVHGGVFQDASIAADAVEVFVGPHRVAPKAGAGLNSGEFEVLDPLSLRLQYPVADLLPGAVVPFRLLINGAESAPNWVTVP
jgi:hypothetical protein